MFGHAVSRALRAVYDDLACFALPGEQQDVIGRELFLAGYSSFCCNVVMAIHRGVNVTIFEFGSALLTIGAPFPGGVDEWAND